MAVSTTLTGTVVRAPEPAVLWRRDGLWAVSVAVPRLAEPARKRQETVLVHGSAAMLRHLSRGDPIEVSGRLIISRWEHPEGCQRSRQRVVADTVRACSSPLGVRS